MRELSLIDLLLSNKYLIRLNAHLLPDYSFLKGYEDKKFDIASKNEKIRRFSISELRRTLNIAKKLEMKYIVIHGGKFDEEKQDLNERIKTTRKTLKEINNLFKDVKLCIENLPTYSHDLKPLYSLAHNPEELLFLVKGLNNIGICFDVGHANTFGNPIEFYNKIKKSRKVWDMHIHDNKGNGDMHLSLGQGNINFRKFLKFLIKDNYDGYFSIELDTWKKFPNPMERKQRIRALSFLRKIYRY